MRVKVVLEALTDLWGTLRIDIVFDGVLVRDVWVPIDAADVEIAYHGAGASDTGSLSPGDANTESEIIWTSGSRHSRTNLFRERDGVPDPLRVGDHVVLDDRPTSEPIRYEVMSITAA